ncbi:hypothetical protein [Olivibacter sitiensis]|nr:hypothetical protein [Olivibacter sitiensis]
MLKTSKQLLHVALSIVLLAMAYCGYREIKLSHQQKEVMAIPSRA